MKQWTGTLLILFTILSAQTTNCYTVTNGITKEMTGYEFWNTKYYPDHLHVSINGKPMDIGSAIEIAETEKTMLVRYDYSFAKGFRTGAKEILFEFSPEKKSCALSFSWYDKWRIIAKGATPKEVKRVRYKA